MKLTYEEWINKVTPKGKTARLDVLVDSKTIRRVGKANKKILPHPKPIN